MTRLRTGLAGLALALAATAANADGERIAFFTKNQTNPHWQNLRLGADSAARQMKASITHYIPTKPDSIPEQLSQIEDVIVKRPDAIMFVPVDYKAMTAGIRKVNAAKIPMVDVGDRAESGQFVAFVGASDYDLGLTVGRHLFKEMGGRGNVVVIEGVRGTITNADRTRGFQDALKDFPDVKLVSSQPANYQRLAALQVTENLLQTHPKIDGIFAANDSMATGVVEALEGAKRKALVVGINGTKEAVDAIAADKMLATGDYAGFLQGCLGAMTAIRSLRGLPVKQEILIKPELVTKANYKKFDVDTSKLECPTWESTQGQ